MIITCIVKDDNTYKPQRSKFNIGIPYALLAQIKKQITHTSNLDFLNTHNAETVFIQRTRKKKLKSFHPFHVGIQ